MAHFDLNIPTEQLADLQNILKILVQKMANFQTIRNSLKKLENKRDETNLQHLCGALTTADLEELECTSPPIGKIALHVGYLVTPNRLTENQWTALYGDL